MTYQKRGYWYRSQRKGRHVVSEYLGPSGVLIAEMEAIDRNERKAERETQRRERARITSSEAVVFELSNFANILTAAFLVSAGFRTHKRQWRCKRDKLIDSK